LSGRKFTDSYQEVPFLLHIKSRIALIIVLAILSSPVLTSNKLASVRDDNNNTSAINREMHTRNVTDNQVSPRTSNGPSVVSLDGSTTDAIPDFVSKDLANENSPLSQTPFVLADNDLTKPNITSFAYENLTDGNVVTWMHPGDTVRLWFKVKGPLSPSGPVIYLRFDGIVDRSTDYAYSPLVDAQINDLVDISMNQSVWLYGDVVLPADTGSNYGWGTGLVDGFAPTLYQPALVSPFQLFEEYYGGLNDKSSFLHMFGEIQVKKSYWYNYTYDQAVPEFVPCAVAERNWAVFVEFQYWVIDAPVWNIGFMAYYYRDIVSWPDGSPILITSESAVAGVLNPGVHTIRPTQGWLLEEDWTYGSQMGQTRGLYTKLELNSSGVFEEIYDSKEQNEILYLVDNIKEQPPIVDIRNPMEGEVIEQTTCTLTALVSDPNSNYQISEIMLYVNDIGTSIKSDYNPLTGIVEHELDLSTLVGRVNITVEAVDSTSRIGNSTVLIILDSPLNYFPASYNSGFDHYVETIAQQSFNWTCPLNYNTGSDLNITLIPFVEFGFGLSLTFDVYHSTTSEVHAGSKFTTFVSVSNPSVGFSIWFRVGVKYDIYALTAHMQGSLNLIDETWNAVQDVPLGVHILDLRYDIPEIADIVQRFTHYEIPFLDAFPLIGDFANLDLIIDIVPLLKISNALTATVSGLNCVPEGNSVEFVSDKMFALAGTVDSDVSGQTAAIVLRDIAIESSVGLDLYVNFTLNGGILGHSLANIDLNQWLYDTLGIVVPHLNLWNSTISLPLPSDITLGFNVSEQQMDIEMIQLSADEDQINITVSVDDELQNGVPSATVQGLIGSETYAVTESTSGRYIIGIPYRASEFELQVTVSKSGYLGATQTYTIYIDPLTVDSTPPSIQGVSTSPETPSPSDQVTVSASISDDLTGIVNPVLHYSTDNGKSWDIVNMSYTSGSNYEGVIPSFPADTDVLYFISVSDRANNAASSSQFTYTVTNPGTTSTSTTNTQTSTGTTTGGETNTGTSGTSGISSPLGIPMAIVIIGIVGACAIAVIIPIAIMRRRKS
jgi:hypothetical protein